MDELAKVALVGTAKHPQGGRVASAVGDELLSTWQSETAEGLLLLQAGVEAMYSQAGFEPPALPMPVEPSPPDAASSASPASCRAFCKTLWRRIPTRLLTEFCRPDRAVPVLLAPPGIASRIAGNPGAVSCARPCCPSWARSGPLAEPVPRELELGHAGSRRDVGRRPRHARGAQVGRRQHPPCDCTVLRPPAADGRRGWLGPGCMKSSSKREAGPSRPALGAIRNVIGGSWPATRRFWMKR